MIAVLVMCFSAVVFAEDKVDIKVSGLVFAHYQFMLSNSKADDGTDIGSFNSFDVSRIYLNADAKLDEKFSAFIQLEANKLSRDPWSAAAVDNTPYVKQANIKIKDIYPGAMLMLGLIPSPWRGFEEGIWKHRFVSKTSEDIDGLLKATDRGVGIKAKWQKFDYDVLIVNGEGTGSDTNKYKDFIGKVSYAPGTVEGLKINLYGQKGDSDSGFERNRIFLGASYESEKWNGMVTYLTAKDKGKSGKGFSLHGVFNIDPKKWVFARYDNWDPDKDTTDDASSRFILGAGHKIREFMRGALSYQSLSRQKESATKKDRSGLYYSIEVKF